MPTHALALLLALQNGGPLTPEAERATFTVAPGFAVELVLAEPAAKKVVDIAFDDAGRMWAVTACEYPLDGNEDSRAAELYARGGRDQVLVIERPWEGESKTPRVFEGGLAMPMSVLPLGNSAIVQHGSEILRLDDTDGDGRADRREVLLRGFGIEDSHLMPHRFLRGPDGWIYTAQGAFNRSLVVDRSGRETRFDHCKLARFTLDGARFEIVAVGLNNIWGIVFDARGEFLIQEANDLGFGVIPLVFGATYPGIGQQRLRPYAPVQPTATELRFGGTGLSGLALTTSAAVLPAPFEGAVFVANPIERKVQAVRRSGSGLETRFELLPELLTSTDPRFRPVAIHFGPDDSLYVVDWYNPIISHNEVPRTHPDRDRERTRVWRVRAEAAPRFQPPDLTRADAPTLLAGLESPREFVARASWRQIVDRKLVELAPELEQLVLDSAKPIGARLLALWSLEGLRYVDAKLASALLLDPDASLRQSAVRALAASGANLGDWLALAPDPLLDADLEVRCETLRALAALESDDARLVERFLRGAPTPDERQVVICEQDRTRALTGTSLAAARERLWRRIALETRKPAVADWLAAAETARAARAATPTQDSTGSPRDADTPERGRDSSPPDAANTGAATTGAASTGAASTGVASTGASNAGAAGTGAANTGAANTGAANTGAANTGAANTGAASAGAVNTTTSTAAPLASAHDDEARALAALVLDDERGAVELAQVLRALASPLHARRREPVAEELALCVRHAAHPNVRDFLAARLLDMGRARETLTMLLDAPAAGSTSRAPLELEDSFRAALVEALDQLEDPALLVRAASKFGLDEFVDVLDALAASTEQPLALRRDALRTLVKLGGASEALCAALFDQALPGDEMASDALLALAASKSDAGRASALGRLPDAPPLLARAALREVCASKPGAEAVVAAALARDLDASLFDERTLDSLRAALAPDGRHEALEQLTALLGRGGKLVLVLGGGADDYVDTNLALTPPFTLEAWVQLEPGIDNRDGLLALPGRFDFNFAAARPRLWLGPEHGDVLVARRALETGRWTHVALTASADGRLRVYQDGELDSEVQVAGWSAEWASVNGLDVGRTTPGGAALALTELRVWSLERSAREIALDARRAFDGERPAGLVLRVPGDAPESTGPLSGGARFEKRRDTPALLDAAAASARAASFEHFGSLAVAGDSARGRAVFERACQVCHVLGGRGESVGPALDGVGARGIDGLLAALLEPSAAVESGYRELRVELLDGTSLTGLLVSSDDATLTLRAATAAGAGEPRVVPRTDVARLRWSKLSVMPEGLLQALEAREAGDLLAYLIGAR
jgi:putative membrane-bound dehydrogenase-like protein